MTGNGIVVSKAEFMAAYQKKVFEMQDALLELEQVEMPVLHDFAPGVYTRRILMKKGTFAMGETHRDACLNTVISGAVTVMVDGDVKLFQAGDMYMGKVGEKKMGFVHEDTVWMTIHPNPTNETDPDKLKELLVFSREEERKLMLGGNICQQQR